MPGAGLQGLPAAYWTVQIYKALLVPQGRHARRAWPVAGRTKPALHIAAHCASASEGACSTGPSIRAEHPALYLRPARRPHGHTQTLHRPPGQGPSMADQQCGQGGVDGKAWDRSIPRRRGRPLAEAGAGTPRCAASSRAPSACCTSLHPPRRQSARQGRLSHCRLVRLVAHWSGKHKQAQLFLAAPPWPLPVPRLLRHGALSCQMPDGALAWGFAGEVREAGLYKQASRVECKQGCTPPRQLFLLHRRRLSVKDIPAHCRTTSCQLSLTGHVHSKRCCGSLQVGGPCRTQA